MAHAAVSVEKGGSSLEASAVVLKHQEVVLGHQESRQEFIAVFKVVFPEAANTFYSI